YRRLASDLATTGRTVLADLSGEPLTAALQGGVSVLKVSHEDLIEDGRAENAEIASLVGAMREMGREGADRVVGSRGADTTLALVDVRFLEVDGTQIDMVVILSAGESNRVGRSDGTIRHE